MSSTLDITGRSEIGLYLLINFESPFLNTGITLANFSLSGKIPVLNT